MLSKTQIDRLGERLKKGSPTEADLIALDEYRRSFGGTYETVVQTIRNRLQLQPTGRPAKSTRSLIEKLNRESIRLSQVQDVAGCRIVVTDVTNQDKVVASLFDVFPKTSVVDRRTEPKFGYRAVHVIPKLSGKLIEIQIRTSFQHFWAELSEKFSDMIDPSIKYGGGSQKIRDLLIKISSTGVSIERMEYASAATEKAIVELIHSHSMRVNSEGMEESIPPTEKTVESQLKELKEIASDTKAAGAAARERIINWLENEIWECDDLFD